MLDLALRKTCITSTDIGPIFGVDDWRDAFSVWVDKKTDAPPMEPNNRMRLGKFLERGIMSAYEHVTGRETRWCDSTVTHATRNWMAATPDAFAVAEARGVDAKLIFWDQRARWGETPNDIPRSIQLQMWWMMAVCEFEVWDVAALVGDDLPRIYTIERDREAEGVMIARAEEFHRRYIVGDETPPIGGSDAAAQWLQQAFPRHKRPDLRLATEAEAEVLDVYVRLRLAQKTLAGERADLENHLKLAIADKEGLIWDAGRLTWRKTKDRSITDWQSCALGMLNEYIEDPERRDEVVAFYTRAKEGSRRLLLKADEIADAEEQA
jgi:predicted phage-related endonuclease